MSIEVMTAVWDHSTAYGGDLLILLAVANYADVHGRAYPSIRTLAQRGRMTERNAQYCIQKLEAIGELKVERNAGPHGTHVFHIRLEGAIFSGCKVFTHRKKGKRSKWLTHDGEKIASENIAGVQSFQTETHFTGGVKPISPEPSLDPSVKEKELPSVSSDEETSPKEVPLEPASLTPRRKSIGTTVPPYTDDLPWPKPTTLAALYNALKPEDWSVVQTIAGSRLKKAQHYLNDYPELSFWQQALTYLQTAQWLHVNLRQESKNFDWFIKQGQDGMDNCLKLNEGKFQTLGSTRRHEKTSIIDDLGADVQDGEF